MKNKTIPKQYIFKRLSSVVCLLFFLDILFWKNGSKLLALTENNVFKNNLPKEHAL